MIFKDADSRSAEIACLEARRVAAVRPADRQRLAHDIAAIEAGLAGERDVARYLNRLYRKARYIAVWHDVRVPIGPDGHIQIDHIVLNSVQRRAFVIETKNFNGRLSATPDGDWAVDYFGGRRPVASPWEQVQRNAETMQAWFKDHGVREVETVLPVVLLSPTTDIDRKGLPREAHILKSDQFLRWTLKQVDRIPPHRLIWYVVQHLTRPVAADRLAAISQLLLAEHALVSPRPTPSAEAQSLRPGDRRIEPTPYGPLLLIALSADKIALRTQDAGLGARLNTVCRGVGEWQPRYANWIVSTRNLQAILAQLRSGT